MAWKNPQDKLAWRRRYAVANRDKILVWQDTARNKKREQNKDSIERREKSIALSRAKREHKKLLVAVADAINEVRIRILQRDGLCKCSTCGEVKPYKSMIRRDGKRKLTGRCRKCAGLQETRYRSKSYICKRCKRSLPCDMFDRYESNGLHKTCCKECYRTREQVNDDRRNKSMEERAVLFKQGILKCSCCKNTKKIEEFSKSARTVVSTLHVCSKCASTRTTEAYYKKTPQERRIIANSSWKNMIKDPVVRLKYIMRRRLSGAMHRALKCKPYSSSKVIEFIGCTPDELKKYLEAQFVKGMSWDNFGKWEIDHVFPLCNFDLTNHDEMLKAWHYTNLRPLWKVDNRSKHAKIPSQHQPVLMGLF